MVDFFAVGAQVMEYVGGFTSVAFVFLAWASGYVDMMVRAARKRKWGFAKKPVPFLETIDSIEAH